ncbi:PID-CTERM protein-sorting domain-containing protein [Mariniflexile sp. HNIBRBA6329]|uniref:PID-CTERM protein-sorting domain-containing protein n=1 Tax=Mariniflexile sp. HNIBRBA6329 TaxID=3373088 RepID=UPI003746F879
MIIQNKRIFASILFVLISFVCVAQGGPPPPGPPPVGLPIDGGILAGICVGLFYGVKKLIFKKDNG